LEVRVGIDVGGTHTKAVAINNATSEIIGAPAVVMTTHDHPKGVAMGVVKSFSECLSKNNIKPEDVVFVAHSTTQATNALLEGDVANVGVFSVAGGGLEGFLAKRQSKIDDIDLMTGRSIHTFNVFMSKKGLNPESCEKTVLELKRLGANVIVSSSTFGVDDMTEENMIKDAAERNSLLSTMASEITKMYGLTRRTRTAVINASILPKMLDTANSTEQSVRNAGVFVPLMIMRGDGGVMDISEMRKRPILTMLSGPAASVMGSLMYLRASNGIYFEVGGTSTNIGVIKNGRPGLDYTIVGGHSTYVNSLDVRVLGVAGGSMVRANKSGIIDVGPRSAHIAGLEYAVYNDITDEDKPQIDFYTPKNGDPNDYVRVKLKNGKYVAITNSCAANALGLVKPEHFSYGNQKSACAAIKPLAEYIGTTIEDVATQILQKSYKKIEPVIIELANKYKLEKDQMSLVGVGGGAAALIIYSAKKLGLNYSIPKYAEVISSIGVALSMVRDVVERIIPNPSKLDLQKIRKEVIDKAITNGASPDTIEVHVNIDSQTNKVVAIATGSTEVKTAEISKDCTDKELIELAARDMRVEESDVNLRVQTPYFNVLTALNSKGQYVTRIIDKKGFIRVQRSQSKFAMVMVKDYKAIVEGFYKEFVVFRSDSVMRPDFYICIGPRIVDFEGTMRLEQIFILIDIELIGLSDEDEILVIAIRNL
jgi:N-methylhydantoinase A/oxoprolinase/acetone carboxylase beta subunit